MTGRPSFIVTGASTSGSKEVFVATGNMSKLSDYKLYLGDEYKLTSPKSDNIKIDVPESTLTP